MAVTENKTIKRQDGCKRSYPVEEGVRLYQGTLAFINAAGYAVPTTGGGVNRFAGVVIAEADNTGGVDGAINVEVWADGDVELVGTFTQASVGLDAFAADNYTVTVTAPAGSVRIGPVVSYVSATKAIVTLEPGIPFGSAQSITPAASEVAGNQIAPGVTQVEVGAVTVDANDFFVLPPIASVPIGFQIRIAINAGTNCEMRTPASSNTKINDVDADGSQEYLCTDTHMIFVTKRTSTGWVAQSLTKLGAVVTAVVPD